MRPHYQKDTHARPSNARPLTDRSVIDAGSGEGLAVPTYQGSLSGGDIYDNLLTLHIADPPGRPNPRGGGLRGSITTWTSASRLRWMRTLSRVQWSAMPHPLWITLTYHRPDGSWPDDPYPDLHAWLHEIQARYGHMHYVWRLAWQDRGAPHFHIILWPPSPTSYYTNVHYQHSLALLWHDRVDPTSQSHRTYGTKIEPLESYRHAARYISRYVAKEDPRESPHPGVRRWGRSAGLPIATRTSITMSIRTAQLVRRIVRRYVRSTARDRKRADRYLMGHTHIAVFMPADVAARIILHVLDEEAALPVVPAPKLPA